MEPWMVRGARLVASGSSPKEAAGASLARPKSRSLTRSRSVTMMLPGLMSRWMMPAPWAAARASAIWAL